LQADSSVRRAWKDDGQKKIVLQVKDISEMYELKMDAEAAGLPASLITDAGLTEIPPGTSNSHFEKLSGQTHKANTFI